MNRIITLLMMTSMISGLLPITTTKAPVEKKICQDIILTDVDAISVRVISNSIYPNSYKVKIEVQYAANATPPITFYYTSVMNGITYGGTLDLESIRRRNNVTYAVYSGYLYPLE
ncbi:MAG: hypothetical protein K6A97_08985 [Lachnospiraceae bacterium]|nr:hypothetical protein [Lachnospiraceae bacterium]